VMRKCWNCEAIGEPCYDGGTPYCTSCGVVDNPTSPAAAARKATLTEQESAVRVQLFDGVSGAPAGHANVPADVVYAAAKVAHWLKASGAISIHGLRLADGIGRAL
jgi:hypothetical protein